METSSPAEHKDTVPTFSGAVGFTQGPWRLHDMERATIVAGRPGGEVANCLNGFGDQDANANLIAAAPALYAACELALTRLDDGTKVSAKIAEHVRAALKQARGE